MKHICFFIFIFFVAFNLNAQKVTTVDDVEPFFRGLNAEDSVFLDSIKNTAAIYKVVDIKKKQGWYKFYLSRDDYPSIFVVISKDKKHNKKEPKLKIGQSYRLELVPVCYVRIINYLDVACGVTTNEKKRKEITVEHKFKEECLCVPGLFLSPQIASDRYIGCIDRWND